MAYKHKYWDALVFTKLFNNGLKQITCYDKADKPYVIDVYSSTEAVITTKDDDVKRFIFSSMFAKDSLVYGQLTFPLNSQDKLKFNEIKSIRIKNPKSAPEE